MFHSNSGKITGSIRPGKSLRRERSVFATLSLSLFVVGCSSSLFASAPFERENFNDITFAGSCSQKQWSLMPDNSLELLIAPAKQGACEAILEFYAPPNVAQRTALRFEARSTRPGPSLKMGLQEHSGGPIVYSAPFPNDGLTTEWEPDGARFQHLKPGWSPQQISTLHFVVLPLPSRHTRANATVMIRHIRFTGMAAVGPSADSKAVPVSITEVKSIPVPAPTLSHYGIQKSPLFNTKNHLALGSIPHKALFALTGLFLIGFAVFGRSHRRRILSPLYEINTRTWKTHRDQNGVVQFGGFKKISLSDLKGIKQAGFNALWLMGVWEIGQKVRHISKNYASDFHGSPFAIMDYTVSSELGTEQEFRDLVQRAHSMRLSVIVDFIPNHMGLDCSWLNDHPEYFIHRVLENGEAQLPDEELQKLYPGYFPYRTPSYPEGSRRVPKTLMVAYGKDPYFYPWIDTAQLDYSQSGLRRRMIETLCYWARVVDGVRCDMAMLILREQIKIHRHPDMPWETFNEKMPHEFWTEAIQAVKRVNPNFVFLAETYWSMEGCLQNLGFDYTYNKPLYEAICNALHSGHAEGLMNFLRLLGTDFLQKGVHFLENHDEERVMNTLGEERQKSAAVVLCTLPGIALLHQGQLEGKRERMPVQRVLPLHEEPVHQGLHHFYHRLLKATASPVFQEGRLITLYSNNSSLVCYARVFNDAKVLVVVNTSQKTQKGSVFLIPGLRLQSGTPYRLNDLYYDFKSHHKASDQPFYSYPAAQLVNQGLYVELDPFDAHIFSVEPQGALQSTQNVLGTLRQTMEEWPLNRLIRRVYGAAFTRSSDSNLAANPASRQQ